MLNDKSATLIEQVEAALREFLKEVTDSSQAKFDELVPIVICLLYTSDAADE